MHVGQDGRMVHEYIFSKNPLHRSPMKVWHKHVTGDDYEFRSKLGGDSWTAKLYSYYGRLIIERTNGRQFEFERIDCDSVPEAFIVVLRKVHQQMDDAEELAEQGGADQPTAALDLKSE